MEEAIKTCWKCGLSKPLMKDFWYKTETSVDGFESVCRSCRLAKMNASRAKHHKPLGSSEIQVQCPSCHVPKPRTGWFWGRDIDAPDGMKNICVGCQRREINRHKAGMAIASEKQLRQRQYVHKSRSANQEAYRARWRKQSAERRKNLPYRVHNILKLIEVRCKGNTLSFDLDLPYILNLLSAQHNCCAITGDVLTFSVGEGIIATDMSVDRIDPKMGYVKGNVQIVQRMANLSKSNMTMDQFLAFCEKTLIHAGRLGWADGACA